MKLYLLFTMDQYYPTGADDLRSVHDSLEEAVAAAATHRCDHWDVVELDGATREFRSVTWGRRD